MKFLILFFISFNLFSQTKLNDLKWFLNPNGQEIKIDQDDLHTDIVFADPKLQWGYERSQSMSLKRNIKIAIFDGGIDIEHELIKPFVDYKRVECFKNGDIIPVNAEHDHDQNGYKADCAGWNFAEDNNKMFDPEGHGTHVAGVMASMLETHFESIKFLPIRIFAEGESLRNQGKLKPLSERLIKAFEYSISEKVDIIHLSAGWPKSLMTTELLSIINKVLENKIFIVAAAGNVSQTASSFPCSIDGVICVGALSANNKLASFSNFGSSVDLLAAGEKILSSIPKTILPKHFPRRGYDYKNGTSQAAPMVSAVLALLKGFLAEDVDSLKARLFSGAHSSSPFDSLRGSVHLERAIDLEPFPIWPMLKNVNPILIASNQFQLDLKLKNHLNKIVESKIAIRCPQSKEPLIFDSVFDPFETKNLTFHLESDGQLDIPCQLMVDSIQFSFVVKIKNEPSNPILVVNQEMNLPLVIKTKNGVRSRLLTIQPLPHKTALPFYYALIEQKLYFYSVEKFLGIHDLKKNCQLLRIWQTDLNKDESTDFLLETLCENKRLVYDFLNKNLKNLFPSVQYSPGLALINYDNFQLETNPNHAPNFLFTQVGLNIPSSDPWADQSAGKDNHLYQLVPVEKNQTWIFDVKVIDNDLFWIKKLGFRYTPKFQILHFWRDSCLLMVENKTVWVNFKLQTASYAQLDQILWTGSQMMNVAQSSEVIFNNLLTPFEYRGFVLDGITLRYLHPDKRDPILDVIRVIKKDLGYQVILRTFRSLLFLNFNNESSLINQTSSPIERFDFLSTQDLMATVATAENELQTFFVSDATRIHTHYVELFSLNKMNRWIIPKDCSTQQPVLMNGQIVLPLFCLYDKNHYQMRFFPLSFNK